MLLYNAAMVKRILLMSALAAAGCTSHIVPLRPIQHTQVWVPDEPATTQAAAETQAAPESSASAPTTAPGTATSAPATENAPGHMVEKTVDPNQTARFVYKASYDNVWRQGTELLNQTGFKIDRSDYRLGVITTSPLPSAQVVEFWKPSHTNFDNAMENTINNQRRIIRLTISNVPGKPDFFDIAIQVVVERETNPSEDIGGPIFVEGSGFGRNALSLRSDYATPKPEPGRWLKIGHDPDLEKKLIDELFKRI